MCSKAIPPVKSVVGGSELSACLGGRGEQCYGKRYYCVYAFAVVHACMLGIPRSVVSGSVVSVEEEGTVLLK